MCGPMNRKDSLCRNCVDGFGPSVTSVQYQCSNCTRVWYGIPLYLLLEFVPVTIFYSMIVMFRLHLTSAPMTCFIMYSQLVSYMLIFEREQTLLLASESNSLFNLAFSFMVFGTWTLSITLLLHSVSAKTLS